MKRIQIQTRSFVVLALLASAGRAAFADPVLNDYCVEHDFSIRTRGNLSPHLVLQHREYAFAQCGRAKDGPVDNRANTPVGLGVTTFNAHADAGTVSDANSESNVTALAVGTASGEIRVYGDVDLCPSAPRQRYAYGRAFSAAKLFYRGRNMDRRGRIGWAGGWRAEPGIQGGIGKVRRIDPVIGRVTDLVTGVTTEHLLIDIENFVQGGVFEWLNDRVTNTAPTMEFRIIMPGSASPSTGFLVVRARDGVVVESFATGEFAGVAVPAVGADATFAFDLPNARDIEFDMPGDDDHELDVEIEMGGAGEHEEAAGALAGDLYITTALDKGPDQSPVYQHDSATEPGVPLFPGELTVAQPFVVSPEQAWTVEDLALRLVDPGSEPFTGFEAVYVRLWQGTPGPTGRLIAGDFETNRLIDTTFTGMYAVMRGEEQSDANPIKDALVDLTWLPPLGPGQYAIEVAAVGPGPNPVMLPPSPFDPTPQWQPAFIGFGGLQYEPLVTIDGRLASAPMLLFGDDGLGEPCRADLDGDGVLTLFDFLQFQNLFASGDPAADFDGDGVLTLFDFLEFQNAFAEGCQ